jgi:SAM-dependent methyltransferase
MFAPIAAEIIADLVVRRLLPKNMSVVELGNQTYDVDHDTVQKIITRLRKSGADRNYSVDYTALESFLARTVRVAGSPMVEEFYRALGFSEYTAIDVNNRYGSLVMDLNQNLVKEYGFNKQFDLVTNIGVSEHIFDQAIFFRNAHQLTREGGLMFFMIPVLGFPNHGFFNYQPCFVEDLARANSYELLYHYVADRTMLFSELRAEDYVKILPLFTMRTLSDGMKGNTLMIVVVRKRYDREFRLPVQGRYLGDVQTGELREKYSWQYGEKQQEQVTDLSCYPNLNDGIAGENDGIGIRIRNGIRRGMFAMLSKVLRFTLRFF